MRHCLRSSLALLDGWTGQNMCDQPSDPETQIKVKSQIINVQIKKKTADVTTCSYFQREAAVIRLHEEQFLLISAIKTIALCWIQKNQ